MNDASIVLGIETSCDETAAAVVRNGVDVLSSVVSSQVEIHARFGGVVPEVASRAHLESINPVIGRALVEAGLGPHSINAVACTVGPGLIGALLVGVSAAKALALTWRVPFVGVNHHEAHLYAAFLEDPTLEFPLVVLLVSGGHTMLIEMLDHGTYRLLGRTIDDAAGEAYDKVARLLGLGYPGGPVIDRLAARGNKRAIIFPLAEIKDQPLDYSFSGLKTAVLRYVRENQIETVADAANPSEQILDLCASFQNAVVRALIRSVRKAAHIHHPRTLLLAGGVACNSELRAAFQQLAAELNVPAYIPSPIYTTDNAAMIAAAAYPKLLRGEHSGWEMSADVSMRLPNVAVEKAPGQKKIRYRL